MNKKETFKDIQKGKGFGYIDSEGRTCMQRCFECGEENWGPAVTTGECAICGYDPNEGSENETGNNEEN